MKKIYIPEYLKRKKRCFVNKQRPAISRRHSSELTRDLIGQKKTLRFSSRLV